MSVTVTFKLNKPAQQFQAGDSTGFGIRGGVKYYDRETKKDEWTNYECAIFAKSQAQIDYYQSMFVEGAHVSVGAKTQKIKTFANKQTGAISHSILLNDAWLEYAVSPVARDPQAAQKAYEAGIQQAPQQPAKDSFDEDIPW